MKEVRAVVAKQKGQTLYLFCMNASEFEPLCFVEAATRDKQRGLQRVTEVSRLKEIAEYVSSGASAILPNNIIVNLTSAVLVDIDNDGRMATIRFPADEGDFAFVVDGQHRLFSFQEDYRRLADSEIFELPVVALHHATEEQVGETFVSINSNQKPVNRDLLTQMRAILGLLDNDVEKLTIELIHNLEEDPASPLYGRILRYPNERDKWIKVNQLQKVVSGLMAPGGSLHDRTQAERKRIVIAFLDAIKRLFPDAWADDKGKDYALLQPSVLQILFSLLPDVMARCDFFESFNYTTDTMERQLKPLSEAVIVGDWRRSVVDDSLGTAPKRKAFLGELKEALKVKPPTS